jgi:phage shock protein PspC (stress-responsive transcriptional regulator)
MVLGFKVSKPYEMSIIKDVLQPWIERNSFGVCSYLAEKWGLSESKVRIYFIYTSFLALGSPILIYLFTAFWINIKKILRSGESIHI